MQQFQSSESAKRYYTAALAAGDYYTQDIEKLALWRGEAAKQLGLGEQVTGKQFAALADNEHPSDGQPITPRTAIGRTSGYDVNFHCPKGVSLLYTITQDEKILEAFRSAVGDTMRDIERQSQTRVRIKGQHHDRPTGNLVWGEFIHTTTRPVAGIPDPHLHAHCFVFNITHDPVENRFKACQFRDINRDMPMHEAGFHVRFAGALNKLGYATERNAKGWDVAGISRGTKEKFSRRTTEIEAEALRLGITDPARKAELGSKTRNRKKAISDRRVWVKDWASRLDPEEQAAIKSVAKGLAVSRDRATTAQEAVDFALAHKFERESVVPLTRVLESALRRGVGHVSVDAVKAAASAHPEILASKQGDQMFATTRSALAEERAMLAFATEGRATQPALQRDKPWKAMPGSQLNSDQVAAIGHVMTSTDRVVLIRGGAGTGKTTLMKEAVAGMEARGHAVTVVAPTSEAARHVLREAGFPNADTLQKLLQDTEMQRKCKNGVIWCDESGLVGTPQMRRLFELAANQNAKIILSGDAKQHAPIDRGDALRLLESHAGLKPAQVLAVVRQNGAYRRAVELMAGGDFDAGFAVLHKLHAIKEVKGPAVKRKSPSII